MADSHADNPAQGLLGNIDRYDRRHIEGWAFDATPPIRPVDLGIYRDEELIGTICADRHRPDLQAVGYLGEGRCSFRCAIPPFEHPLLKHVVEIRRLSDGAPLPGSPIVFEAAAGFDEATYNVISDIVRATASNATEPSDLNSAATFLMHQVDHLLRARAELTDGDRGGIFSLTQRWGDFVPANSISVPALHPQALFLDTNFPTPGNNAGANAALDHMRALGRLGFQVCFAALHDLRDRHGSSEHLSQFNVKALTAPWYASIEEILQYHGKTLDLIYLHRVDTAIAYTKLARAHCPNALIIYSVADLANLRTERQAKVTNKPHLRQKARLLLNEELTAANWADLVITHSSTEANWLSHQLPDAKIAVIPWSVPLSPHGRKFAERHDVAFIGHFDHEPNQDALHFLCTSILPWVRKQAPDIKFRIYGSNMPPGLRNMTQQNLEILGYADNLEDVYQSVRLTIAPLRFGAGIKGKVIESLAAGVPCVGTEIAYEGIDVNHQLSSCIARGAREFSDTLIRLYGNQDIYESLAAAGSRHVLLTYSEPAVDAQFRELLLPMLKHWSISKSNNLAMQ